MLDKYTKEQLIDIINSYDNYIINNTDNMVDWCPVCVAEFIDNEWSTDEYK